MLWETARVHAPGRNISQVTPVRSCRIRRLGRAAGRTRSGVGTEKWVGETQFDVVYHLAGLDLQVAALGWAASTRNCHCKCWSES